MKCNFLTTKSQIISSYREIRNYFGGSYRKLGIRNNLTLSFSASAFDTVRPDYHVRGITLVYVFFYPYARLQYPHKYLFPFVHNQNFN